jgi:hypothetical protein
MHAPTTISRIIIQPTPTPIAVLETPACPLEALFIEEEPIDDAVGKKLGLKVGPKVGPKLGKKLGPKVGPKVGLKLGKNVGMELGCCVGVAVFSLCMGEARIVGGLVDIENIDIVGTRVGNVLV